MWLVSLGQGCRRPSVSGRLSLEERCLLQGFAPSAIPSRVSDAQARRVMGNAMTVPVVGNVLGATLLNLQEEDERSSGSSSDPGSSADVVGNRPCSGDASDEGSDVSSSSDLEESGEVSDAMGKSGSSSRSSASLDAA